MECSLPCEYLPQPEKGLTAKRVADQASEPPAKHRLSSMAGLPRTSALALLVLSFQGVRNSKLSYSKVPVLPVPGSNATNPTFP